MKTTLFSPKYKGKPQFSFSAISFALLIAEGGMHFQWPCSVSRQTQNTLDYLLCPILETGFVKSVSLCS